MPRAVGLGQEAPKIPEPGRKKGQARRPARSFFDSQEKVYLAGALTGLTARPGVMSFTGLPSGGRLCR